MQHLKIRKVGNSLGLILPRDTVETLGVVEGDDVVVTANVNGEIRIRRSEPDFDEQVRAAERIMERYKNALAELAK